MSVEPTTGMSLTLFERHVKQALRIFHDPERLGEESPLASTYLLARALRNAPRPVTVRQRGEALCKEIRSAAARLWPEQFPRHREQMLDAITLIRRDPEDPRYAYVVLELRCFQEFIEPARTSDIWEQPHLLPGSKSQHYRDYDAAIKRLAVLLLDALRPALRDERPRPPELLIGYDRNLAVLTDLLARDQTVALIGPGGVGKTSLAARAIEQLGKRPIFWYTLRPGLNDGVSSLLFALGAFLHDNQALNLWQYLITANGVIGDLNLAAGLLRQDLGSMAQPPLLCFDDMERVSTGALELLPPAHTQLLDLIDGLRGFAAVLLISQRPTLASDQQIELSGLCVDDLIQLWASSGRELTVESAEQLHSYTGGNPRLLTLLLALSTETPESMFQPEPYHSEPSLLPAFQRIWHRLTAPERRALQQLSVYQGFVPEDVLVVDMLATLVRLRLVERDGGGGVSVLPALVPIVRDDLGTELRDALHREAAIVRLERGEYTAAAYHFVQGSQEDHAIQIWFPQRQLAVARGEADAARPIFNAISRQRLGPAERKALDTIRAELRQLSGQHEPGLQELEQADWPDESESSARLWMLRGELEEALGYPDKAIESYNQGIQVTARLLGRLTILHQRRGLLYHRRREHQSSWQEIHRAEFELAVLRGLVREEEGSYSDALESYQRARGYAEQLNDDSLRAQAERRLAALYGRRQELEAAISHASQAVAIYERMGDRLNLEKMRVNLSFIYVQTRQFAAAVEVGKPTYAFFVAVHDPYFAGAAGANLAEASFELGDLDGAANYANEVLALGHRHAMPYAYFTLGQIAMARSDPAGAIEQFQQSMQLAQQNDDPYMVAYAQRSLGQAYQAAANHEAGQQQLHAALAIFRQLGIPAEIATTEQFLLAASESQ